MGPVGHSNVSGEGFTCILLNFHGLAFYNIFVYESCQKQSQQNPENGCRQITIEIYLFFLGHVMKWVKRTESSAALWNV